MKKAYTIGLLFLLMFTSHFATAQYTLNYEYGDLNQCDTMTRGIYVVWWDDSIDRAADASQLLDSMLVYQDICLNQLGMQNPPNTNNGHFFNVYLHQPGQDFFPDWWGNGVGTDANGEPYLTLPIGAHLDWINVAHETFHIFQYNATAPGFAYSGDSQWFIEASANWFAGFRYPHFNNAYVESESLVHLPHVDFWLSYDNFPASYPSNWQRYVHQYALSIFLKYMVDQENVPPTFITQGMYSTTSMTPQEYYSDIIGQENFRTMFVNWAAHMTNDFDFLTPQQVVRNEQEWNDYADPQDDNEFSGVYVNQGTNGWFRPADDVVTNAWAFNTYKLENNEAQAYRFQYNGDAQGSSGDSARFLSKVVIRNTQQGVSFIDVPTSSSLNGEIIVSLAPEDTEVFFVITSVPNVFSGTNQQFSYEMKIEPVNISGLNELEHKKTIVTRVNTLGQQVDEKTYGFQLIYYSDGSRVKVFVP